MTFTRHRFIALAVVAIAGPAVAQEQPVKPYVMLLFDTSGSMLWDVCAAAGGALKPKYERISGDNSSECPGLDVSCSSCITVGCGNSLFDDTRLYKVKKGASNVVNAFGEVTFGLSRFHQTPASFTCNTPDDQRAGGWAGAAGSANFQGQSYNCETDGTVDMMGTGENQADVLQGFTANNQSAVLGWMNDCDDYPSAGSCPGQLAPSTGCSLCSDCGAGCDREIRGTGNTPLAGALYDLRTGFFPGVVTADAKKGCRPYKVILLTDGQNNCYGDPVEQAHLLYTNAAKSIPVHVIGFASSSIKPYLDQIAVGGGTGQAVVVDNEVSLALAMANIISESLLKELCNGQDDDCDDACDENWPEVAVTGAPCTNKHAAQTCTAGIGICQRTGAYVCKADGSGSQCSATPGSPNPGGEICGNGLDDNCNGQIDEGCVPCVSQPEICDGKDNNCNGQIDEGYVSSPCGSDIGECKKGTTQCVLGQVICNGSTPPSTEICDGKDNNCDTIIDNFSQPCYPAATGCDPQTGICAGICQLGLHLCTAGVWGTCVGWNGPSTEICNGLDDNCDGLVDNLVGIGQACGQGVGECQTGTLACVQQTGGTWAAVCQGEVGPTPEVCDEKDNDCDGQVDEDFPEKGKFCGKSVGECKGGTWACQKGGLVCEGEIGPTAEICDGKDNDCNGVIDDNVPGVGQPCGTSVGECKPGVNQCLNAKIDCVGGVQPTPEICDGKDNDCDGLVDDFAECPGGSKCVEGECMLPCGTGEFNCPGGTECQNGYCIPAKCANVTCKPTERCVDGNCLEKCAQASCEEHEECEPTTGKCVDDSCYSKGCPSGQTCVAFECVKNPCPPGQCPADKQCVDGKCYDTCLNVTCDAGETCVRGACVKKSPCDGYPCDGGFICKVVSGAPICEPDPCRIVSCTKGQICRNGTCASDPCSYTTCPEGLHCQVNSSGDSECTPIPGAALPITQQILTTGGGGCTCRVGDGDSRQGLLMPLLGLLLWASRRRGRRGAR